MENDNGGMMLLMMIRSAYSFGKYSNLCFYLLRDKWLVGGTESLGGRLQDEMMMTKRYIRTIDTGFLDGVMRDDVFYSC